MLVYSSCVRIRRFMMGVGKFAVHLTCLRGELPLSAEAVRKFGPMHVCCASVHIICNA